MNIGDLLQERYQLESEIGQGGMGTVYRAHDQLLDRSIAIKVMNKADFDTKGRSRLLDEARTAAKLNHPNIVSVYDAGEIDDLPFIVMELVDGTSLHDRKVESLEDILDITRQLCAALKHAHEHDIIHRDLKPENVLIKTDGVAKLSDFGLARSISSRLTSEGIIVGTVFYLAPEMAQGRGFDGRADLYALGVMLYELTTGELPFQAENAIAVISQHLNSPVVPPRAKNESIPHGLNSLILRLLSKSPEDRPASAGELLRQLRKPDLLDEDGIAPEEFSVLDRIQRGRMVGRETEHKQATALWSEVLSGQGRVLMISGEPGIGKSRLVRELTTHAEVTGGWALEGASYAESGSPYGPFRQVLREVLSKDSERCCDLPQEVLADVLSLTPELIPQFPDVSANPPLDPQAERQRLFENMVIFFSTLSDHAPLLLILEDAHWADSGTLALMLHLARNTRHKKLMIVAPYREVELDEARPFHEVLLDIQREGLAVRLKLNRLTRSQSQDLLGVLFAEEILPDFLDGIYRETEGNPFFIEEVCKAMLASGKLTFGEGRWHRPSMEELGVPQSVQVAIQSRVGKLPEVSQEILKLAAVIGRVFDLETIAKTSDLEEDQLIDAMEDAENAQLIEGTNGREGCAYRFSHALIPSTLVVGLRTRKRRELHRDVAAAIEQVCPDDFEALAYHYNQAGEDEKAVTFYLKAGDRARSLFAFQETVDHYEHALEILRDGADIDRTSHTLMKLGLAYHNEFDYESAQKAYEEGFTLWQRAAEIPSVHPPAPHALRFDGYEPDTLDSSLAPTTTEGFYIVHLFSGLLQLSPTLNLMPDVATNWDVVDGGRKYIFHLREDVRWSDGVEVTAGDFEYAMKRVLNPSTEAVGADLLFDIKGAKDHNQGERGDPESIGVHAKDEHTLVVELEAPTSYFLYIMAHSISFAVPQHVVERCGSTWTEKDSLVTNGPFQLTTWDKGELIVLSRNTNYHGYFPGNVDRVEHYFYNSADPTKALQAYLEGDRDIFMHLQNLPKSERERVCHQHADEYVTAPSLNTQCLHFNVRKPPFDDRRVRQAFTLAVDRESWVRAVYGNQGIPAMGGFIPPGMPGHSPGIATRYNPEAARALLKEAGYPNGEGLPPLELWTRSSPVDKYEYDNIRLQWLDNLGVDITLVPLESFKYFERISQDEPLIWRGAWLADYVDPDNFMRSFFEQSHPGWKNDSFSELVARARSLTDQKERMRLYQQADRILVEEAPLLPLFHAQYNFLVKPWVKKITASPMVITDEKYTVLEPH